MPENKANSEQVDIRVEEKNLQSQLATQVAEEEGLEPSLNSAWET